MRVAYIDCFAGIAGDMLLGALVDAGVPAEVLVDATAALGLGASLRIERVDRSGIACTKVHVLEGDHLAEAHAETAQSIRTTMLRTGTAMSIPTSTNTRTRRMRRTRTAILTRTNIRTTA